MSNNNNKIFSPIKLLIKVGIIAGIIVFAGNSFFAFPVSAKVSFGSEEKAFIVRLNDLRKEKGLKALKVSKKLSQSALLMAEDMANNPDLINHEHKDSLGRSPSERAAIYGYTDGTGENIAAGYKTSSKVYKAWKDSSDHYANMIGADYEVMGIALVKTSNNYKWYWVNTFGEVAHASNLVKSEEYAPAKILKITVNDTAKKAIRKARVKILSKGGSNLGSGNTNSNGKKSFTVNSRDEYYVRVSAKNYQTYTKEVKPGNKDEVSVKVWLESN